MTEKQRDELIELREQLEQAENQEDDKYVLQMIIASEGWINAMIYYNVDPDPKDVKGLKQIVKNYEL